MREGGRRRERRGRMWRLGWDGGARSVQLVELRDKNV